MIALLSSTPKWRLAVQHWVAWSCLDLSVKLQRRTACFCSSREEHFKNSIADVAHAAASAHEIERQHNG